MRTLTLLVCIGASACGEGSSDVSDRFPDDIDTGLTLDDLGDSAFNRLCSTFESWVRDQYASSPLAEAVCTHHAIENTETASECADSIQDCLDNPPPEAQALLNTVLTQAGCSAISVTREGCAATVGQIEDCLDALSAALDNLQLTLSCAAAGQTLDPGWYDISTPSACTAIESLCP